MQFCPACLAADAQPHFRKRWRVAFCTWCPRHNAVLHDRCPNCGAAIAFHRRDLNSKLIDTADSIASCWQCNFDLKLAPVVAPKFAEDSSRRAYELAVLRLERRGAWCHPRGVSYYNVLHQLCRLIGTRYRNIEVGQFAEQSIGVRDLGIAQSKVPIEMRTVVERHHIAELGFWFMADLETRLTAAWNVGAVTYSALFRDFDDRPGKFNEIVRRLANWRARDILKLHQ